MKFEAMRKDDSLMTRITEDESIPIIADLLRVRKRMWSKLSYIPQEFEVSVAYLLHDFMRSIYNADNQFILGLIPNVKPEKDKQENTCIYLDGEKITAAYKTVEDKFRSDTEKNLTKVGEFSSINLGVPIAHLSFDARGVDYVMSLCRHTPYQSGYLLSRHKNLVLFDAISVLSSDKACTFEFGYIDRHPTIAPINKFADFVNLAKQAYLRLCLNEGPTFNELARSKEVLCGRDLHKSTRNSIWQNYEAMLCNKLEVKA